MLYRVYLLICLIYFGPFFSDALIARCHVACCSLLLFHRFYTSVWIEWQFLKILKCLKPSTNLMYCLSQLCCHVLPQLEADFWISFAPCPAYDVGIVCVAFSQIIVRRQNANSINLIKYKYFQLAKHTQTHTHTHVNFTYIILYAIFHGVVRDFQLVRLVRPTKNISNMLCRERPRLLWLPLA